MSALCWLLVVAALWLPTVSGFGQVRDTRLSPDSKPPVAFSAARHKTTAEMEKLLASAAGDEAKRLELVNAEWGGKHPIDIAVMNGSADVVQLLIEAGAQLHNPGANGQPPLHLAAWKGNLQLVEMLHAAGADPLIKNKRGETALEVAENSKMRTQEVVDFIAAQISRIAKEDL